MSREICRLGPACESDNRAPKQKSNLGPSNSSKETRRPQVKEFIQREGSFLTGLAIVEKCPVRVEKTTRNETSRS